MDVPYLHDVDDVVRDPEHSEGDDDGEDELLTAHSPLKPCLSQAKEDTHITADDDCVREQEPHHRLHAEVDHHLFVENDIVSNVVCYSV